MSHIEQEIEQIADSLEKSNQTPKEKLFETIRKLGPVEIKARLGSLEKAEKELLLSALQEMKKAVEMDKNYAASYVKNKIDATVIQEDKADDDQDEKLVLAAAATVNHQGTPTPGWEGQVIKGKEMSKEKAKDAIMAMEEKEHGTKNPKKLVEAEKKENGGKAMKCMKKGEMPFGDLKDEKKSKDQKKDALKKIKKSVEDQLKEFGVEATPELVKSEMKRLLAEESQDGDAPEMNEKTRANKESVAALELGKDSKEAQKKVNDEKQGMKKAIWSGENDLLKANTNGRNHHFSMEQYLDQVLAESEKPAEEVKKSEGEAKEDLNDIIQKGGDANWDMVNTDRLLKANKIRGTLVKSFEQNEIAEALGLTEEEAKKILGE
jgi:hypothetical protein